MGIKFTFVRRKGKTIQLTSIEMTEDHWHCQKEKQPRFRNAAPLRFLEVAKQAGFVCRSLNQEAKSFLLYVGEKVNFIPIVRGTSWAGI